VQLFVFNVVILSEAKDPCICFCCYIRFLPLTLSFCHPGKKSAFAFANAFAFTLPTQNVISTEGGGFAVAVERPCISPFPAWLVIDKPIHPSSLNPSSIRSLQEKPQKSLAKIICQAQKQHNQNIINDIPNAWELCYKR
jgi:hypothetical protein